MRAIADSSSTLFPLYGYAYAHAWRFS